ncbi:hypothetical protein HRbin15_01534 [bacterium HR15]|nr:hypothetical protein HRbin15_01534 [bacterium HR15]
MRIATWKLPLLICSLMCHFGLLYGQATPTSQELRWTVRPGSEAGVLTGSTRSRVEGDRRLLGKHGTVIYSFRVLSGMDVQIQLTVGGRGRVRVRAGEQGLLLQRIPSRVQTQTLITRTPYQPPVQTLQVIVEADRRGQVVFYGLTVRATQRDEDGDGIGDGTERLLHAPANTLKPLQYRTVVGEPVKTVQSGLVQTPVLFGGEYQQDPFSMAFLYSSALVGQSREGGQPLLLAIDPMLDVDAKDLREHQRTYFTTLVAALMFPQIQPVAMVEPLLGQTSVFPPEYIAVMLSAVRAAEAASEGAGATLDAGVEGIGMLVPDSILWDDGSDGSDRSAKLDNSRLDIEALALPLIRAGIPLRMVALSNLSEPNRLRDVRLLLWTPEVVSPHSETELDALINWVRKGGWLLVVGVPSEQDATLRSAWKVAGYATPFHWLAAKLGLNLSSEVETPPGHAPDWQEVARHGDQPERGTLNRRWVEVDLSAYAGQTLYVRFSDRLPDTGWGALLRQVRLETDGRILTAFYTGTTIERLFLYAHSKSQLTRAGERVADGTAWFVYRFPLPSATRIALRVEIAQEWRIEVSTQPPYPERMLIRQRTDLPVLTLRHDERLMACEAPGAEILYLYQPPAGVERHQGGEAATKPIGVLQSVGRGGIVLMGVSGRAFGNSPNGEAQWRQFVRFVAGRAGMRYRERARFTARRGDWMAAYGTYRLTILRGTFLDALDPRLPVLTDPTLEPRAPRLLLQIDERLKRIGMLHTNAQIVLQHTTSAMLAYLLRGPDGVPGVARLSVRGLSGQVQLLDAWGNPAPVNVERAGGTLLVRWNLSQNGHVLIVR